MLEKDKLEIIGNEEWCSLGEFKIPALLARIDSGAKTSSLQAREIKLIKKGEEDWVRFVVSPLQKSNDISITCEALLVDKRSIKGSFGISEERFIIKTPITIGENTFDIEISLANRNTMKYKMLLGREAVNNRYLINTAERRLQKKYSIKAIDKLYESQTTGN